MMMAVLCARFHFIRNFSQFINIQITDIYTHPKKKNPTGINSKTGNEFLSYIFIFIRIFQRNQLISLIKGILNYHKCSISDCCSTDCKTSQLISTPHLRCASSSSPPSKIAIIPLQNLLFKRVSHRLG